MTKELSKQLCELCGIKPHYGVWVNYGDLDNNYQLRTNERKYRLIADYRYSYGVDKDDLRNLKPEYCPDFGQPENFVTLFDLEINHPCYSTMVEMIANCHDCFYVNSREFIQNVIKCIKSNFNASDIKQSIREEEWVYE